MEATKTQEYRILRKNEIMEEGDEWRQAPGLNWIKSRGFVGEKVLKIQGEAAEARRPITNTLPETKEHACGRCKDSGIDQESFKPCGRCEKGVVMSKKYKREIRVLEIRKACKTALQDEVEHFDLNLDNLPDEMIININESLGIAINYLVGAV